MDIKFTFEQRNLEITIELLPLPIIKIWADYLKDYAWNIKQFRTEVCSEAAHSKFNPYDIKSNINSINNAYLELKQLGYSWPSHIPLVENNASKVPSQQELNQLHRFFTENWRWCFVRGRRELGEANPFDPKFKLPAHMDNDEFYAIIDKINVAVHNLEQYTAPEPTKKFVLDNKIVPAGIWIENRQVPVIYLEIEEYLHNYKFQLDQEDYPVVVPADILGKSVLHSYLDNDNPLESDCLGRSELGFNLFIDINNNRRKLYNSQDFKNWANKYGTTPTSLPLEFQIGHLRNSNLNGQELNYLIYNEKLTLASISFL